VSLAALAGCGGGGGENPFARETATALTEPAGGETPAEATLTQAAVPALTEAATALREGRYDDAAAMYERIAVEEDGEAAAEAWLGAGVATYERGDTAGALAKLRLAIEAGVEGSGTTRRAAYLLGRRLNEAGEFAEARSVLEAVASVADDPLQAYLDVERGRALAAIGDRTGASLAWEAALAAPGASDPLKGQVYRARAESALGAGDTVGAVGWLKRLVGVAASAEDRYELAALAAEAGDMKTFEEQLREIVRSEPSSDYAVLAIDDLRMAGRAVDGGSEGYVYYRRRSFAQAREVLGAAVLELGLAASDLAFRTYYLAASYEDAGFPAESVPLYDEVAAIAPVGSPYGHRAKYWAARATESVGGLAAASERYLTLAAGGPPGEFTAEAAFRAGFVLLKEGDAGGALAAWDAAEIEADARLLYWTGRAREAIGDADGARVAYQAAVAAGPYGLYGEEAGRLLGIEPPLDVSYRTLGDVPPMDWQAIAEWVGGGGVVAPGSLNTAAGELVAIGLRGEAVSLLQAEAARRTGVDLVPVLREAHEAGLSEVAARMSVALLERGGERPWEAPRSLLQLAYPLDYVTRVLVVTEGAGLDPLLLAALIRQESFWDPAAVSIAGAMGLAQVMPATGAGIAAAIGPDGWGPGDLLRPSVSLAFGAYYLGLQLERFGSPWVALSAYNAGPGNAIKWQETTGSGSVADFVEAVDISETKHYVEAVLEHYAYYRHTYRRQP
jgi:soluble lytic murein transglycosylase